MQVALNILHIEKTFRWPRESKSRQQRIAKGLMKPKRTILCVDDNEQSLSHRKIMLETRGYRVASFSRGEEALERFRQGGIDLVVTDMAMPGLDGPQLIAAVKNLSPQTPAVLISSKVRIYSHESQADVFLTKGMYAPADLLERIRILLVRKRGPRRMQQRPVQISPQIGAA
jgi:CheY-like chemotaxis protein